MHAKTSIPYPMTSPKRNPKLGTTPEPKCVQWKRKGQRALMRKLAGMTRDEQRAFWRESYNKMLSERAESKRRAQAKGATN